MTAVDRERIRLWIHNNRDRVRAYARKSVEKMRSVDPEGYKARRAIVTKRYREKHLHQQKKRVMALLGGKCVRCGFSDFRALQVDHVNGNGAKERKELGGWYRVYRNVLITNGLGYQLLCANCNWIKRYENGEHGQRKKAANG